MKRRTVLNAAGLGIVLFTGCTAEGDSETRTDVHTSTPADTLSPTPPQDTVSDTPSPTPLQDTSDLEEFNPASTYKHINVGSREGVADDYKPHDVRIWNVAADPRDVNLRITDRMAETAVLHETYEIPADTALAVSLLEPSNYRIELWIPVAETQKTLQVPCGEFDCNTSATQVRVFEDGQIRVSETSTLVQCPSYDC